jgi:molybdopterin-synthase adenylyltransferase
LKPKPPDRAQMFHRQLDVLDPAQAAKLKITIIGAGAIGSFTALSLAKIGVTDITVYDDDDVEIHNIPNQWYRIQDVGVKKVIALRDIVEQFTGVKIRAIPKKYVDQAIRGFVISGVDSMDARIGIWKNLKGQYPQRYLDARMGAEVGELRMVNPVDIVAVDAYEKKHLFPSTEATPGKCTARSTMYCASGLAAMIAARVSNFINKRPDTDILVDFRNLKVYSQP